MERGFETGNLEDGEMKKAEKEARIKEIFKNEQPDAITVLSGGITVEKHKKEYKPTAYSDVDEHNLIGGGKARVIAAAEASLFFPEAKIVTNSYVKKDAPTHAQVMADELKKLGLPESRIILQINSINTISELVETIKLAVGNNWKNVAAITNDFQIPRAQKMYELMYEDPDFILEKNPERNKIEEALGRFKADGGKISFIKAEDILPLRSPHYQKIINAVKQTDAYKKRIEVEKKALKQLDDRTYKIYWKF